MVFNSYSFWIFLAAVCALHALLKHRGRNLLLLTASYFFYACWDWRFLSLILITTTVDFFAAGRIAAARENPQRESASSDVVCRRWLTVSLIVNLGILGVFKYFGFFTGELDRLLIAVGAAPLSLPIKLLLPVGISFYTFQALSYTIDVYRGNTEPARRFSDFALYIAFFPQLVAGPIERSSHLLPQVTAERPTCDRKCFREGLFLVLSGLFLKVVIADNMAWLVAFPFSSEETGNVLTAPDVMLGTYAFALQIYGDFAGYSAIAIGVAKWLGFELMANFRHPYFALDPRDFWRRWHISLSTWLRDYLYIFALGGNRGGAWKTSRNLFLTMLLGGLWHGAAWTFIVWGIIHGLWLVIHRSLTRIRQKRIDQAQGLGGGDRMTGGLRRIVATSVAWFATFHLVCLGWLFFRAVDIEQAFHLLGCLAGPWEWTDYAATCSTLILFFAGPWMMFELWLERRNDPFAATRVAWPWRLGLYSYIACMLIFFPPAVPVEFIYFRF